MDAYRCVVNAGDETPAEIASVRPLLVRLRLHNDKRKTESSSANDN